MCGADPLFNQYSFIIIRAASVPSPHGPDFPLDYQDGLFASPAVDFRFAGFFCSHKSGCYDVILTRIFAAPGLHSLLMA